MLCMSHGNMCMGVELSGMVVPVFEVSYIVKDEAYILGTVRAGGSLDSIALKRMEQ